MKKKVTVRIPKVLIFIVAFLFVSIIVKLAYVSLSESVDGVNLHVFASNRNTKSEVIYAKRGNIYDKDGNPLAQTVNSYKLIAILSESRTVNPNDPQHVVDKDATAKMLNEMIGIPYETALKILQTDGRYQVEFGSYGSGISESLKNKIEEKNMPGVIFESGQKRAYSKGAFASYIVGYAKMKEAGNIVGELGLESFYNEELKGTDGLKTYETDAYGYTLPSAKVVEEAAKDGYDIYTTLDQNIQLFAENLTTELTDNYDMNWMIFSVMDAKTGAIVASSTFPNFDPNDLNTLTDYKNPLVSTQYEPGSVMKTFAWATAIELGVYDGTEKYPSGKRVVGDATIKDHNNGQGWGSIPFDTGFTYSSNVAASYLADKIEISNLTDYYNKLGFGKKTGIELANEGEGIVGPFNNQIELDTAAFGQGKITVTPIQMLQALSALTNDGTILKPYIVDKMVNSDGEVVYDGKREEVAQVYSKETMDYMRALMHSVVYDGTSTYWRPSKTTMIGKTGTAQIAKNGKYLDGAYDYVRSFAGIFPEEDPKYIVYIAVEKLNSTSAKPIGNALTKAVDDIVAYLGLETKEQNIDSKVIELNNYISTEIDVTEAELKNKKLSVYKLGTGKYIINQYPLKKAKVLEGSKIFLVSNMDDYMMEDLTGWSLSEVMTYANLLNINLTTTGYGYVTSQSIPKDTAINAGDELVVNLSK